LKLWASAMTGTSATIASKTLKRETVDLGICDSLVKDAPNRR
jgi:hypothetical protein